MEARKGNGAAAVALAHGATNASLREPRWSGGDELRPIAPPQQSARQILTALLAQQDQLEEMERKQAELAQAQTAQAAKVDQLLAAQQAAEVALRAPLGPVMQLPPLSRRAETNRIVRDYCQATGDYRGGWNKLFREHRDRFHVDLKARAKIRGVTPAVIAEELGRWDHLHALAVELFCKGERVFHA